MIEIIDCRVPSLYATAQTLFDLRCSDRCVPCALLEVA